MIPKEQEITAKIIVADDDNLVCDAVVQILEMFGYQAVGVQGGLELLKTVDESFDVVLLDIHMPDLNGFEAIEELNRRGSDIPIVLLTGRAQWPTPSRRSTWGYTIFSVSP